MTRIPLLIMMTLTVLLPVTACSKKHPQVVTKQAGSSLETIRDALRAHLAVKRSLDRIRTRRRD